jgi:hypothetical protein
MSIADDFGGIDNYLSLDAALEVLSSFTKTSWDKDELFDAVVHLSLPVYAVSPPQAVVGIRSVEVNGSRKMLHVPAIGARLALLLTHEIDQLGKNHHIVTNRPALVPGDPDYKNWDEVKAGRQSHPVRPSERTRYDKWFEPAGISGEWMGQSDKYFFTSNFPVYPDDVRFPRNTLIELIRMFLDPLRAHELRRFVPDDSPFDVLAQAPCTAGQDIGLDSLEQTENKPVPVSTERSKRTSKKWDEYELRRLLDESRDAGSTHEKLAAKYGVTRQRIAVLLNRAKELFGVKKPSVFDFAGSLKRK